MPNLGNWLGGDNLGGIDPMFDISNIMERRGQLIELKRTVPKTNVTTELAAQRVIPAPLSRYQTQKAAAAGIVGESLIVLIGYRSYPGQTDFDVKQDDRFLYANAWHRVIYVDDAIPNRREAYAESAK